jgi:hypothetical protein
MPVNVTGSRILGIAVAALLLAGTGLIVWNTLRVKAKPDPLAASFQYRVNSRETRSACVLQAPVRLAGEFDTGLSGIEALATGPDGQVAVAGDGRVVVLDASGSPSATWAVNAVVSGLAITTNGVWAGIDRHVAHWTAAGRLLWRTPDYASNAVITSVAVAGDRLFVADAGGRVVYFCNATGGVEKVVGRGGGERGGDGFVIPSPYFDVAMAPDGLLRVVNPGRHRIEAYTGGGDFELAWGKASMGVEGFCGCCNPAHFAVLPDGSYVTSEKGLRRVKTYDAAGRFTGVILGTDELRGGPDDCSEGPAPCPVAADARGRILVAMPDGGKVRVYEYKEQR